MVLILLEYFCEITSGFITLFTMEFVWLIEIDASLHHQTFNLCLIIYLLLLFFDCTRLIVTETESDVKRRVLGMSSLQT